MAAGARMGTPETYWAMLTPAAELDLPVYTGEIRSAGRWNILPNVASNHVDQRAAEAVTEATLRDAEAIAALELQGREHPTAALAEAWTLQHYSHSHDSEYASGTDGVARDVMDRLARVRELTRPILDRGLASLAGRLRDAGDYAVNLGSEPRDISVPCAGGYLLARDVPALGYGKLEPAAPDANPRPLAIPGMRCTDQPTRQDDTYTVDPKRWRRERTTGLRPAVARRPGEDFARVRISWRNTERNHRVRLVIKLDEPVTTIWVNAGHGATERDAVPRVLQGHDRLNGFPTNKFIVAGGYVFMVDKIAEYEYLPKTNEIAFTLLRSHGLLSSLHPRFRLGSAGPVVPTHDTQLLDHVVSWEFGIARWDVRSQGLPWRLYEQFALPPRVVHSNGGGQLPPRGALVSGLPDGVVNAVRAGDGGTARVRWFDRTNGAITDSTCPLAAASKAVGIASLG